MKNAAKCDTSCDLQNPVNHQNFERTLRFRDMPGSMLVGVSVDTPRPRPPLPSKGGAGRERTLSVPERLGAPSAPNLVNETSNLFCCAELLTALSGSPHGRRRRLSARQTRLRSEEAFSGRPRPSPSLGRGGGLGPHYFRSDLRSSKRTR